MSREPVQRLRRNARLQLLNSGSLASQLSLRAFPGTTTGQPRTRIHNSAETLELQNRVSDAIRWTLIGRYYDSSTHEYGSFVYPSLGPPDPATLTLYPVFTIYLPSKVTEGMVDANLAANLRGLGGRHELLGGFNYDHTNFEGDLGFNGVPVGTLDLAHPNYELPFGDVPPVTTFRPTGMRRWPDTRRTRRPMAACNLLGAVRLTRFSLKQVQQSYDTTYVRANPRVGGTFDIVPGIALYGAFATGFRGAVNFIGENTPRPETSRNEEGGVKLALSRIGLSGTVAAFQQVRRNVSNADPNNPFFSIQTGEQRARGVEADATWEPVRATRWRLRPTTWPATERLILTPISCRSSFPTSHARPISASRQPSEGSSDERPHSPQSTSNSPCSLPSCLPRLSRWNRGRIFRRQRNSQRPWITT